MTPQFESLVGQKPRKWSSLSLEEKRSELRELKESHYWAFLPLEVQEHIQRLLRGELRPN